ncbi:Retrovirus-related Pol polyprotein from transposon TNT 1-94 [Sesbania bispinosa]|nr:Retrovirus-related Pol polyprotein from transposon TNT 1-94 [Sesbania bispinosa]
MSNTIRIEKFNGKNSFNLWRIKMRALLKEQRFWGPLASVTAKKGAVTKVKKAKDYNKWRVKLPQAKQKKRICQTKLQKHLKMKVNLKLSTLICHIMMTPLITPDQNLKLIRGHREIRDLL